MNIGRWTNLLLVKGTGIFATVLGGALLLQIPSMYRFDVDFRSKAVSATGTITEVREEKEERIYHSGGIPIPGTATKFISTVNFQTNQGEWVEFTTSRACSSQRDCMNKLVPVMYDPDFPSGARVDLGTTPERKVRNNFWFSVFLLLPGIALLLGDVDN
ncbi:MAG: hypothetical protein HC840_31795 [Leptolyngbyaceae cyanobacterium RM2_2_4]|nr:hypothetical protein [Leptolyngbyaceae cyanobacterium SM1_4_3]NJN89072.1 hypothetical protein [Leptolyngbyaceae cyanobacterium SL_5_14]NJO53231.1 hypothetical protein [Leptolyngbyaceae cyanobacterium RM2_2_4]